MAYREILNNIQWSFSTLSLYENCPYSFYLKDIEKRDELENFFSENGSIMHEVFAALLNKEITLDDAPEKYIDLYDCIDEQTSKNTMDRTFESCLDYLCEVKDISPKYDILGVEHRMHFKVFKNKFVGIADCILRDTETGEIWLVDHKSSGHFLKKNGEPLKSQEQNFYSYRHQMYLYCKGIKDTMGLQVDKICWHHFKDNGELTIIPFNQNDYDDTLQWADSLIKTIKKDKKFTENKTYMMCNRLCSYRDSCEYKEEESDF